MPRPSRYAPDTLPPPRHWCEDAACRGEETATFFPATTQGVSTERAAADAKAHCAECPVQPECLRHALTYREDHGVWGGLDEHERAALLRRARRTADQARREKKEHTSAPTA